MIKTNNTLLNKKQLSTYLGMSIGKIDYLMKEDKIGYRWSGVVEGFDLPVKVYLNGEELWLEPKTNWQAIEAKNTISLKVDPNFYVTVLDVMGS